MAIPAKPPEAGRASETHRDGGQPIEKSAAKARQGRLGRPVLYILIASLALVIAAYILILLAGP